MTRKNDPQPLHLGQVQADQPDPEVPTPPGRPSPAWADGFEAGLRRGFCADGACRPLGGVEPMAPAGQASQPAQQPQQRTGPTPDLGGWNGEERRRPAPASSPLGGTQGRPVGQARDFGGNPCPAAPADRLPRLGDADAPTGARRPLAGDDDFDG